MSEQHGDATNVWHGPHVSHERPVAPRDAAHDQTSATERAFAEGWPAQPGWVPEGGIGTAWGAQPLSYEPEQQYQPEQHYQSEQSFAPQANQTWVPQQAPYGGAAPYPTSPDAYPDGGYPPAGGPGYPGPDAPLPRSRSNSTLLVLVVVGVLLIAGVVGGVFLVRRGSGGTTPTAAVSAAPNGSTPNGTGGTSPNSNGTSSHGTSSNGTSSNGTASGSTNSGSKGSTSTSSGSTSGKTSTAPPMTGSSSIDLTTVHVPAYAASPDANDVAHTLDAYFTGINSADYATAYDQLSPSMQAKNPYSQFEDNTAGTIDSDVTVTDVTVSGDGSGTAAVTFTSTQPGDKGVVRGQTCTNWSITYTLQLGNGAGGWLITGTPSAQHSGC